MNKHWLAGLTAFAVLLTFPIAAQAATDVDYFASEFGSDIDIDGENDDDDIVVSISANTVTISDTGTGGVTTTDVLCANVGGTVTCPFDPPGASTPVEFIDIETADGIDSATNVNVPVPFELEGEAGNKTFQGGPGDDYLAAGPGNSTLNGGAGDDYMEPDRDVLFGSGGADVTVGGPGSDWVSYQQHRVGVSVSFDGVANDGPQGESDQVLEIESVETGRGDDTVIGDEGANEVWTAAGNDVLRGLGGNDELDGGSGDDLLDPGAGRDAAWCGDGIDTVLTSFDDFVYQDCERTGARVVSEAVDLNRKGKGKLRLVCDASEAAPCVGKVTLRANGKALSKGGAFNVAPGAEGNAKLRLTKRGKKKLKRSRGSLLVTAEALTNEPGGQALTRERVQLLR